MRKGLLTALIAVMLATQILPADVASALDFSDVTSSENTAPASQVSSDERPLYDLVAVVVDENFLNDEEDYDGLQDKYDDLDEDTLEERIERYADDVRKALPETKVLILPVSATKNTASDLQKVLERLYFEGDPENSDDERTQLRGIVLIGDVPLPVVDKNGNRFVSLFPYTDFVDKSFIWNAKKKIFEYQTDAGNPQPEVWHGLIRPPKSSSGGSAAALLATYLDKNHLYHSGHPDFADFEKRILMSDLIREKENLNPTKFPLYENFLNNMENLAYNRYSAKWLMQLQKEFNTEFGDTLRLLDSMTKGLTTAPDTKVPGMPTGSAQAQKDFLNALKNGGPSGGAGGNGTNGMKDILSIPLIQQFHLPYFALFGNYLSRVNDFVDSTGRWNTSQVDTVASLISKKDLVMQDFFLKTNNLLEQKIDERIAQIQKPVSFLRGVSASGRISGDSFETFFANHSLIRPAGTKNSPQQFVNGIAVSELKNAGECSLEKGSTQVVKSVRALNPMTMNFTPAVIEQQLNPRKMPSLGVEMEAVGGGEIIMHVFPSGLGAGNPVFQKGDRILSIDDKKLTADFSLQDALKSHYPDRVVKNEMLLCSQPNGTNTYEDSCDADRFKGFGLPPIFTGLPQETKEFAKVRYVPSGSNKEKIRRATILDANDPAWYSGCFGGNFPNPGKCFALAATRPVNDFSGTQLVEKTGGANGDATSELNSCSSFFPYESPAHDGQSENDIRDFTFYYDSVQNFLRSDDGSKKTNLKNELPNLPAQKVYFLNQKNPAAPFGAPTSKQFTLNDFFDLFGQMNRTDDNGNFVDTNGNGVADQIVWADVNSNGKLDLCLPGLPSAPALPCADDLSGKQYSGEFIGGDFGVDEPGETVSIPQSERNFDAFSKKYFHIAKSLYFYTPRHKTSGDEITAAKETSDYFFEFAPDIAKEISSMIEHKEPTSETLKAQFSSMLADALPIDDPRYAIYQNQSGAAVKMLYPNIFSAKSFEEFDGTLSAAEKLIGLSGGSLLKNFDIEKIKEFLQWRSLSLNEKHEKVLNAAEDFEAMYFVAEGSGENGANIGNGVDNSDAVLLNFSGDSHGNILEETDPVFQKILNGEAVFEGESGDGIGDKNASNKTEKKPSDPPGGEEYFNEPLSIFELPNKFPWFEGLQKWLESVKKYFDAGKATEMPLTTEEDKQVPNASGNESENAASVNASSLDIFTDTKILKTGGSSKAQIKAVLKNENNLPLEGELVDFDVTVKGPGTVLGLKDNDPARDGVQVSQFSGTLQFDVQSTSESGTIFVSVKANFDEKTFDNAVQIESSSDVFLSLEATEYSLYADGKSQTTLTAKLLKNGANASYNGPVSFQISNDSSGFFANPPETSMTNGVASALIRSRGKSGEVSVSVSVPGIDAVTLPIIVLPLPAKRISAAHEGMTISARLLDANGNVTHENAVLTFRVTDATFTAGTFGGQKQITVNAKNGLGEATISPTGKGGTVNVILSGAGLESASVTVSATYSSDGDDFAASMLYADFLGGNFSGLATNMLFSPEKSARLQSAAVTASASEPKKRLAGIFPSGVIQTFDESASLSIAAANIDEPLRMDIGKNGAMGSVFVTAADTSFDFSNQAFRAHVAASGSSVLKNEKEMLRVQKNGGVTIFDPAVSVKVLHDAGDEGSTLRLQIFENEVEAGTIKYSFSDPVSVSIIHNAGNGLSLPKGVSFVPGVSFFDAFAVEKFYAGDSTFSPMGIYLTSKTEKISLNQKPGHSFTSLEDAISTEGVGFRGNNKHMMLLAAGNSVGVSHLPYGSEIGLVLGDPTVKLSDKNVPSQTDFTKDLGTEIFTAASSSAGGAGSVRFIKPIDLNGNSVKHLLIGYENGEVRLLENTGGEPAFRDRGVFLFVKNGIFDGATMDIDNDGFEDLVVATQQGCTANEVCTDLYRNKKGFLVRENIPLALSPTEKIYQLRAADMNNDGWIDLVTADAKGSVKIFQNDHGSFVKTGKLLGSFGSPVIVTVSATFPDVPKDSYPDVLVVSSGSVATYFVSSDGVNYQKKESALKNDSSSSSTQEQPKTVSPQDAGKVQDQLMQQLAALNHDDSDHDGIPDSFDGIIGGKGGAGSNSSSNSSGSNDVAKMVEDAVKQLRCSGGCLPMPINYAFFAPGPINGPISGVPVGFDPGLPIFGWGGPMPIPCGAWPFWPGCPFQSTLGGRLYLSPTLTAGLGFAVCLGPYLGAQCRAFNVPIKPLLGQVCEKISGGFSSVLKGAAAFAGGSGYDSVIATGGPNDFSPPTGSFSSSVGLGEYQTSVTGSKNIRVPGFPGFLVDWLDAQIEEALNKLGDLPDLYLIYPSLSSITGSVIPKIPKGKLSGFTKFLTYLNSIPLIKIDPREVEVRLPALSPSEIQRFKNDIEQWKTDFAQEVEKIKNLWKCNKTPNLTLSDVQLCNKVVVNANATLNRIEENLKTLDEYKQFPKKILDFRNVQTKYLKQIINYLNTITNFTGGYIQRQQKRIEHWIAAAQKIKDILNNWQAFLDITLEYEESCDECKTDRFSLLQILLEIFVSIPTPPIIQFPKLPDIVFDFSKIQAGVQVIWPDIVFTPSPMILPKLPRIQFPEIFVPNFPDLKLILDFETVIPLLPKLPELPVLPDLPPLPLFQLPDIPPAPKIPDISAFPLLKQSLDVLKNILKIVCLVKTGLVPVPETALKTEIETLTARSVSPPLPIDLQFKIDFPAFSYKFVEQFKFEGRANFQLQTQFIYDMVKSFADLANSITTNLTEIEKKAVKSAEKGAKAVLKTSFVPGEIRLIAESSSVKADALPQIAGEFGEFSEPLGDGNLAELSRGMQRYLAQTKNIFETVPLSRFIASASESDTQERNSRLIAANTSGSGGNSGSVPSDNALNSATQNLAQNALPIGIFLQNPVIDQPERLINYIAETDANTKVLYSDFDGDQDDDVFIVFGGDVYLKKNVLKNVPHKPYPKAPRTSSMKELFPALPAVNGLTTSYSNNGRSGVFWKKSEDESLAGYEVLYRSKNGLQKRHYVFDDVPALLRDDLLQQFEDDDIPVETVSRDSPQLNFELENGNYYLQMRGIDIQGNFGTISSVTLLAPQVCGDTDEPVLNLGQKNYKVAILKTVTIESTTSDPDASHFVDLDLTKDDNGDKDPTNDKNILFGPKKPIILGPFMEIDKRAMKLWAVDVSGNMSGEEILLEIYIPDLVLDTVNAEKGTVSGFTNPAEAAMPFTLVRERGKETTAVGSYQTDSQGKFLIEDLNFQKKSFVKNAAGERAAEVDPLTGKMSNLKKGYSLVAEPATLSSPTFIHLKDSKNVTLFSVFLVPEKNGLQVKDLNAIDAFDLKPIPVSDPQFGGGQEVIYTNESLRVAVIDTLGRIFIFDPRMTLRVKENAASDPYVFELVFEKTSRVEVSFATGKGRLQFVDSAVFDSQKPFSLGENAVTVQTGTGGSGGGSASQQPFSDVPKNSPYFSAIQELQKKGIVEGYKGDDGGALYKPEQLLSRAEYTKIVLKALCIVPRPAAYEPPTVFSDIIYTQPLEWFYPFVKESFFLQLITGYLGEIPKNAASGKLLPPFKPNNTITRAEAAKILLEALRLVNVLKLDIAPQDPKKGPWYEPYLNLALNLSPYLKNSGTPQSFLLTNGEALQPNHEVTRGEFAVMANRVFKIYDCSAEPEASAEGSLKGMSEDIGTPGTITPGISEVSPPPSPTGPTLHDLLTQTFPPGIYGMLPACTSCPCASTYEEGANIAAGDRIYAVFANNDLSAIYQKSNIFVIP